MQESLGLRLCLGSVVQIGKQPGPPLGRARAGGLPETGAKVDSAARIGRWPNSRWNQRANITEKQQQHPCKGCWVHE